MARKSLRPPIDLRKRPRPDLRKDRPDPRRKNRDRDRQKFPWPGMTDPMEEHSPLWPGAPFEVGYGDGTENFPLTTTPIGYDIEIVKSDCEIGIRGTPQLGFFNLPPVEIIYRIPGCREPEEVKPLPPIDLPDVPVPPRWPGPMPDPEMEVDVWAGRTGSAECVNEWWPESRLASLIAPRLPELVQGDYMWRDVGYAFTYYFKGRFLANVPFYGHGETSIQQFGKTEYWQRFNPDSDRLFFVRWHVPTRTALPYTVSTRESISTGTRDGPSIGRASTYWIEDRRLLTANGDHFSWVPDPSVVIRQFSIFYTIEYQGFNDALGSTMGRYRGKVKDLNLYLTATEQVKIIAWASVADGCPKSPFKPPPPPPPMTDCPCQHNDRLLKELLARVQKIELTVGAPLFFDDDVKQLKESDLPFAPERLIYPKKRGDKKKHPIKNLVELLEFQIRQVDRAVGDLPITIKIKDADPSKEGDQKVEAEFHSLGSAMKEVAELAIESGGDVDLQTLMLCRILYECGFVHQGSIQTQFIVEAIADWLDFPVKYKTKKFPFAFNPRVGIELGKGFGDGQDQGDVPDTEAEFEKIAPKLLKETDTPIKIMELNPKQKTTQKDAIDEIQRLIRVCAASAGEEATPQNLDNLINIARLALKMDGLIRREDIRQAMTTGLPTGAGFDKNYDPTGAGSPER